MTPFTRDEIMEIASSLEDYHKVFYVFFEMANVCYFDAIPTAAIRFSPQSEPDLLINPEFWARMNHRERLFIICHECLHVLLKHDVRNGRDIPGATDLLINVAQDICINEMFVSLFGFNRDDIRDWKKYCWIDTCFDDQSTVLRNETFKYYLELLIKNNKADLPDLVDEHPVPGDGSPDGTQEKIKDVVGKLAEELSRDEIEKIVGSDPDCSLAGAAESMMEMWLNPKKRAKINFVKLIRHLKRTRMKELEIDTESFVEQDRRYEDVIRKGNVTLPGKHPTLRNSKDRLLTVLFMDISGSCISYVPTFNKVFAAFDRERNIFEIETFTFALTVNEVKMGQRITGGGGTRFHILEEKVQQLKVKHGKYPDCVVVISDGEGTALTPELPSRWVWLLTPDPMYTFIDIKSKKYLISEVIL
jgi:predicted metal-dependent peptidase